MKCKVLLMLLTQQQGSSSFRNYQDLVYEGMLGCYVTPASKINKCIQLRLKTLWRGATVFYFIFLSVWCQAEKHRWGVLASAALTLAVAVNCFPSECWSVVLGCLLPLPASREVTFGGSYVSQLQRCAGR